MSTNGTLFTVSQTAARLGITRQAVQQMIQEKRLNAFWMLEKWAIPEAEILRIKKERRRTQRVA